MSASGSDAAARLRQLERHGAASLRAVSAEPHAEYRASRLRVNGQAVPFAAPYLAVDFAEAHLARSRGVADSLGLRLRHSDNTLHRHLSPESGFACLIFDVLEQLRCDSLMPSSMRGVRRNLDAAFTGWCEESHGNGLTDSELGILLYTVIHMVRARLIGTIPDETAEALIEATRANLSSIIGKSLYKLASVRHDQTEFAVLARDIADSLDELISESSSGGDDAADIKSRTGIVLPPDWQGAGLDQEVEGIGGSSGSSSVADESLETAGNYHIFSTEFDAQVSGESLFREDRRRRLRTTLDQLVMAQAVSQPRLARELLQLLASPKTDGWVFGQDEGLLDARRLSQLVSNPAYHQIFLRERQQLHSDAIVSFLIDNSGSMKTQRFEAVAVLIDTFCRALSLAGITSEVLGFTTRDWNGGRALQSWRKQGSPAAPGRLGEAMHIVYKDADVSWRRARQSLASLLDTQHFREGLDGEALIWAYRRLQARAEPHRYLVVISDGAPMDAATRNANHESFLSDHLISVAKHIDRQPGVHLGAIGIDLDLSDVFTRSLSLDLNGTLGQASYRVLHDLFGGPVR